MPTPHKTHAAADHAAFGQLAAQYAGSPPLTVIVPVYNEMGTIDALLHRVLAAPYEKQVIVVDDGSTDGTAQSLRRWADRPGVEVLRQPVNRGKGAAIRRGLELARGRFTVIQDADLEYDPQDYARLIEPLERGEAQAVFGSRYLRRPEVPGGLMFRTGVRALNWAVRALYGQRLTDEATCYKAMPTELLRSLILECERFEFCPEVTAKLCRLGIRIVEVPISYYARDNATGKKIRTADGVEALRTLWKWRRWNPPQRAIAARAATVRSAVAIRDVAPGQVVADKAA